MSLRIAATLVALSGLTLLAQEKEKKAPPAVDRQAQLDLIIEDFVKARKASNAAMRSAKSAEEQKAAEALLPKESNFLPRVYKLIANGASDETAADALAFAVFGLNTKDTGIYDAIAKNFVKTDKIRRFLQMAMSNAPEAAKPVLEKVLASNPSKEMQGLACYALASMAFEKEGPATAKEAETFFARVEKEFADVKAGRGSTLGEMAKGSLFELRNLQVGMKAPITESKDLKGAKASLKDHAGKVVILDIWATWCGPCRAMIPHEREMVEKFKGKPFALISVSADDDKKELEEFIAKEPMPWVHWWDGADAALLKQWNIRFYPSLYVIDAKGVIRYKHIRGDELEKAVEKLLAETK